VNAGRYQHIIAYDDTAAVNEGTVEVDTDVGTYVNVRTKTTCKAVTDTDIGSHSTE
jgi:hypothetical protein